MSLGDTVLTIKKITKLNKKYFNRMKYPSYLESLEIDKNVILLESQHGREIDGNIYYLTRELLTNPAYGRFTVCISARDRKVIRKIKMRLADIDTSRLRILRFQSDEYYRTAASAGYLFNDNTFADFFIKREGQTYTNVWHGTPLKTLGRSDLEKMHAIGNAQKNFFVADYLLYPNEYTKNHMVEDYMIENLSKATTLLGGYPRNTAFFDEGRRAAIREKENFGGRKVYAYMPTWRSATFENQEMLENILSQIDNSLADNELFYVKLHPVALDHINARRLKHIKFFPEQYETYEFINAADCLITDYSSVMFDYAVTGRKIVLFTYDEEKYDTNRGMYMKLDELPFARVQTTEMLFEELRNGRAHDYSSLTDMMCRYDNPDAARKLCQRTIFGEDAGFIEEPVHDNGKENIIIYPGNLAPNGITLSLISLLKRLNTSKYNYYLTFTSSSAALYLSKLKELPEGVGYISCVGKMNATLREKFAIIQYSKRRISFERFHEITRDAYRLDYRRLYGDNKFKTSIQYSGYNYKKILSFLDHEGKHIIYVHNDMKNEIETRENQREEVLRYAYHRYEAVVAVSDEVAEKTEALVGKLDNLHVANNIVDVDGIKRKKNREITYNPNTVLNREPEEIQAIIDSDAFKFVNVARFSPEKGHERLILAFEEFYKENPNSYLFIIGGNQWNGMYYQLRDELLPKLKCRNNVVLILEVDNPFAIVGRCDGFIFSSFYEGFGMVLMEAAALELPVASVELEASKPFLLKNGGYVVENSQEGIYEGLKWLAGPDAVRMHADFDKYNHMNTVIVENIIDDVTDIEATYDDEYERELAELSSINKLEEKTYLAWKLGRKSGRGKIELRKTESGADRYYNDIFLGHIENDFFRIRNIDIRNNLLNIEGSVGFYGIQDDESLTVKICDGRQEITTESVDRNHERDEGISMRVIAFRCKMPLKNSSTKITIKVSVSGIEFEEEKLLFDMYSPIGSEESDGYESSYYYCGGWSVTTDGKAIFIDECSLEERNRLETRYQDELIKSSSRGKAISALRSKAIELIDNKTRPIWLINDRASEAGDNGEAFFIYMNENHKEEIDTYFVLNRSSEDFERMKKYGRVVEPDSEEHHLLMMASDAIIGSHFDALFRTMLGEDNVMVRDLIHKPFILLEHGMSPGKDFHTWLHRSNKMISGFVVASEEEHKQYTEDKYGYTDAEVWPIGLPRFDRLYDKSEKIVTVAPTWRKELFSEKERKTGIHKLNEGFSDTEYAKFWKNFMEDAELNEAATRLGYSIVFRPHPNFRHQEEQFGFADWVNVSTDNKPYRDIFAESSLMITDYSGVAFDFGYLNKPVLYAQFEKEGVSRSNHIYNIEDSYDYHEKGFGEVETNVDALVARTIEYMENGCAIKPEYQERIDDLYKYHDRNNCRRVYEHVIRCIAEHGV